MPAFLNGKSIIRGILLFVGLLGILQSDLHAQATTTLFINPASSTVTVGQSFSVTVRIDLATAASANAVSARLNFDRSLLQVTNITKPSAAIFTSETISLPPDYTTMNGTGAGSGQIDYSAGIPAGSISTDFDFLTITFTAVASGNTTVAFNTTSPRISRVVLGATVLAGPPTNSPVNGSINIVSCTPPTASIANTGTCNSQPFNLVLNSATGTGPYSLVINGTTYNNVNVGGTITTITPSTQNFFGTADPGAVDIPDAPVTLGLKFSSSVAGFVKGVRFFSQPVPGGTYTGQLWSASGSLLAQATFTGVTGNAWQQVLFSAPVLISANTYYIVSYHTTSGYEAVETALNSAIISGNLTAPASGTSTPGAPAGNGLYTYDPNPGSPTVNFPASTFNATNYTVDVIFAPNTFTYNLTSVTDNGGCTNVGAPLQSLSVTSVDCSTLPVTLLNLSATPKDKDVTLKWSTATELDNKGFEVQRRTPNGSWETIGFVYGAGNSVSQRNYTYTDKNLFSGRYFYQLKQVDIDGHYKYSMIVSANIDGRDDYALTQNYPNPFRGMTTIQYTLPVRATVNISIFDMNGRLMKTLISGNTEAGNHAVNFYSGSLPAGMYYYRIQADNFNAVRKMVIQ